MFNKKIMSIDKNWKRRRNVMSVDCSSSLIFGVPCGCLRDDSELDEEASYNFWRNHEDWYLKNNAYTSDADGFIGILIGETDDWTEISPEDIASYRTNGNIAIIKQAYETLTGEQCDQEPGLFLVARWW